MILRIGDISSLVSGYAPSSDSVVLTSSEDSSVVVSCSPDKNESMSVRKIRLFLPEPETSCIFTSCSLAYFLTEGIARSEEHTSELQSRGHLVCRLLLEKKKK